MSMNNELVNIMKDKIPFEIKTKNIKYLGSDIIRNTLGLYKEDL